MLYDTIYHVAIAGRTFVVEGNEQTAKFRWKKHADNACLEKYVTLFSRMGIVRARFEDGEYRKMMAFENHGGNCNAYAFLLYLCAMGWHDWISLRDFLQSLARYITDRPATYRPLVHDWGMVESCSQKGVGLYKFHSHAFASKYDVPVREFHSSLREADSHLGLRGEWDDWTGGLFARLRPVFDSKFVPPSYNMSSIDDTRACNIWAFEDPEGEEGHAVLIAHITQERPKRPSEFDDEEDRNEAVIRLVKTTLREMLNERIPLTAVWMLTRQIVFDAYFAERPAGCPGYWKSDGKWAPNVGQRIPTRKRSLTLLGGQMPAERVPWHVAGRLRAPLFYTRIVDEMKMHHCTTDELFTDIETHTGIDLAIEGP